MFSSKSAQNLLKICLRSFFEILVLRDGLESGAWVHVVEYTGCEDQLKPILRPLNPFEASGHGANYGAIQTWLIYRDQWSISGCLFSYILFH